MSTKEQPPPSLPKLVKLDKALKLAEQWVSNMSGNLEEESTEMELEGLPARLGLGAKISVKSKPVHTNDHVGRKLLAKLDSRKRKATGAEESTPSANASGSPFAAAYGDDNDDDDSESRTNAFSRKRAVPLTTTLPMKKKKR
ncbi:hypothetical protein Ancab_000957 [Ancistrocladus abbreviatus]